MTKPKKIAEQDITGQKGINLIESRCLAMGLIFRAESIFDAGVDGAIEIREAATGTMRNYRISVQSKATQGKFTAETDQTFTYMVEERDLEYWLGGNLPTILIRSRPDTGESYWVWIDEYFKDPDRRKGRKIEFDKEKNRFDKTAREALVEIAIRDIPGEHVQLTSCSETLVSNLLKLNNYPDTIYVAPTTFDNRDYVWTVLGEDSEVGDEWILRSGMIYSFHNLKEPVWRDICDSGAVEPLPSSEWADGNDVPKRREFVELLNRSLDEKLGVAGVDYNNDDNIYYFELIEGQTRIEGSGKGGPGRTVVETYKSTRKKDDKVFIYHRHYALRARWTRIDDKWLLELTPTYFFTRDGENKYRFHEDKLKGIKRLEKNAAVRYLVEFWAHFLSKESGLFGNAYPFLSFSGLETFSVDFGFNDALWKNVEDAELPKDFLDLPLFDT